MSGTFGYSFLAFSFLLCTSCSLQLTSEDPFPCFHCHSCCYHVCTFYSHTSSCSELQSLVSLTLRSHIFTYLYCMGREFYTFEATFLEHSQSSYIFLNLCVLSALTMSVILLQSSTTRTQKKYFLQVSRTLPISPNLLVISWSMKFWDFLIHFSWNTSSEKPHSFYYIFVRLHINGAAVLVFHPLEQ